MAAEVIYRSRVDAWLVGALAAAVCAPLGAAAWLFLHGVYAGVALLTIWGAVMILVVGALTYPVRYTLGASGVRIQSGWLSWDLPYAGLYRAVPSRNPLSAPAWSLRRLKLENRDGSFILVSPEDRESFMEELSRRCPHLRRTEQGLEASPAPR